MNVSGIVICCHNKSLGMAFRMIAPLQGEQNAAEQKGSPQGLQLDYCYYISFETVPTFMF